MMHSGAFRHAQLSTEDVAYLQKISADLGVLADLCRADLTLFCRAGADQVVAVAHAVPTSSTPVYERYPVGNRAGPPENVDVLRAFQGRTNLQSFRTDHVRGATIARQFFPVRNAEGRLLAIMSKDAYWLAHERHRRRSRVFQDALLDFIEMVLAGRLSGADALTPFGEHDGIVYVGADRHVRYMSGIAAELYRQLGFRDSLLGRGIDDIGTVDHQLFSQAVHDLCCIQSETEQGGLTWIRKCLPITVPDVSLTGAVRRLLRGQSEQAYKLRGVFILVHDATEALRNQRELESKMALVREVHHRVKNNLQVIASITRMQARRATSDEAKGILEEAVNRILSVAVVHEFLSRNAKGTINLRELANRIVAQTQSSLIRPEQHIQLGIEGQDIWLQAERVTQCALVINELLQNAIEHGMGDRSEGRVMVRLIDEGERVTISVMDSGQGLPEGFSLDTDANLGLRIVDSMVRRDLQGRFTLSSDGTGTQAVVRFDKSSAAGGG